MTTRSLAALFFGAALAFAPPLLARQDSSQTPMAADPPATASDVAAAASAAGAQPIHGDGVFRAFHGKEGIDRIIDDFVNRVTTDPRIAERFKNANLVRLRLELKQQVCFLTGGPCVYTGKDMKSAHAGMALRNSDFNALAEDLQISMNREHVSFPAQNRLLAKLAPMQHAIVTK
jgi:hemoglobin